MLTGMQEVVAMKVGKIIVDSDGGGKWLMLPTVDTTSYDLSRRRVQLKAIASHVPSSTLLVLAKS